MKHQTPNSKLQPGPAVARSVRVSAFGVRVLLLLAGFSVTAQPDSSLERIPPLRPPHAEIPPTFWEQHGLWVVLGGVLVVGLVCAGVWLLMRPKAPVIVPPVQQARQALEPLGRQPEDGVVLSRVSQVVRHYLAAAFNLPPGELTTKEFCLVMLSREEIGAPLSVPVTNFLRQCDERKFAPGTRGVPLSAVAQALKLIELAEARRIALAGTAGQPNSAR